MPRIARVEQMVGTGLARFCPRRGGGTRVAGKRLRAVGEQAPVQEVGLWDLSRNLLLDHSIAGFDPEQTSHGGESILGHM